MDDLMYILSHRTYNAFLPNLNNQDVIYKHLATSHPVGDQGCFSSPGSTVLEPANKYPSLPSSVPLRAEVVRQAINRDAMCSPRWP